MARLKTIAIRNDKDFQKLLKTLETAQYIAIDTETNSLNIVHNSFTLVGICLAIDSNIGYYIPLNHIERAKEVILDNDIGDFVSKFIEPETWVRSDQQLEQKYVLDNLFNIIKNKKTLWHNYKYDLHVLNQKGYDYSNTVYWDSMIAGWILDNRELKSLKAQTKLKLKRTPIKYNDVVGKLGRLKKDQAFTRVPIEDACKYAAADAANTYGLFEYQKPLIDKNEAFKELFYGIEMPLINVVADMEQEGIKLDVPYIKKLHGDLINEIDTELRSMWECVGRKVIFKGSGTKGSAQDTQYAFFGAQPKGLHFPVFKRSKATGMPSLDAKETIPELHSLAINWNKDSQNDLESLRERYILAKNGYEIDNDLINSIIARRCLRLGAKDYDYLKDIDITTLEQLCVVLEQDVNINSRRLQFIESYKRWSKLLKLASTYTLVLIDRLAEDNKLHTNLNQAATNSGRFASSNPNLQQLPRADDPAYSMFDIRKAFVTEDNYVFICADYCSMEMRIAAIVSSCPVLCEIISGRRKDSEGRDIDIHLYTASNAFNFDYDEAANILNSNIHNSIYRKYKNYRQQAKPVNFGILYGIMKFGLAIQLKCSVQEAQNMIDAFMKSYPGVSSWINRTKESIRSNGYIESMMGRRRYVEKSLYKTITDPDKHLSRQQLRLLEGEYRAGVNHVIQSSSADITKLSMLRVDRMIKQKGYDAKMCLMIHDEIITKVRKDQSEDILKDITRVMTPKPINNITLTVEGEIKKTLSKS